MIQQILTGVPLVTLQAGSATEIMKPAALLILSWLITSCAQPFPKPMQKCCLDQWDDANEIFQKSFTRHGGLSLDELTSLSYDLNGEWKYLITKIQPLVTDSEYRVRSQEIVYPQVGAYHANYDGPKGSKWVLQKQGLTEVFYDGAASRDLDVLQSTALTAESFYIFALGPLALKNLSGSFERLPNITENGRNYLRIYAEMRPGIGESDLDEIVLWIDPDTWLTWRVRFTLEGYVSTQGANVDVTFTDYVELGDFVFPSSFFERVRAPIQIDAHSWDTTNHRLNAAPSPSDLIRPPYEITP